MKKRTQEIFLEELLKNNKHYCDNKFIVVGPYVNVDTKIEVLTRYGTCFITPYRLLKGSEPTIISSINKTEYFKNMCIEKFPEDFNNDLSQVEYINNITKIKVIDKDFGEYFITPSDYISGRRSSKRGCFNTGNKLRACSSSVDEKIRELHPELEFTLGVYTSRFNYIDVKNKYGVCSVCIGNLLRGHKPTILSAIDKTQYFINMAKEIHGDNTYDYSLVEWKGAKSKVKIKGNYGIFKQSPDSHLKGVGCPTTALERAGWTAEKWETSAKASRFFNGYVVYFIECWDTETEERFFKIGRTYREVKRRFDCKRNMPYEYNIIYTIELEDPKRICELEQEYKNKHKEFKYLPKKEFKGMHECFSKIIYI
jgi:hypothetical protein